ADGQGRLRAVVVRRDDRLALLHGIDGSFKEVLDLHATDGFDPYVLSWDGNLIYGLTDENRAQRDLVAFDPSSGQVTKTLFSKPGVDVVAPLMDERRTPIGETYFHGGHLVSEYFGQRDQQLSEVLEKTFPNRTVLLKERRRDGRQLVGSVEGSAQPARLYHLDVAGRRASLLEEARPWLNGKPLVASQRFAVQNGEGLPIEAYLTLPPGSGKRALVVM